ncbi:MAG: endolytic transglycosylase MltG [Patescibacteria group bacterium]
MPTDTKNFIKIISLFALDCIFLMFLFASRPPSAFPNKIDIHIQKESSLSKVTDELVQRNIIRSPFIFKVAVVLFAGQGRIRAGDYRFTDPQMAWTIAYRIVHGDQGQPKVRIIIPEGTNVYDMAFIYLSKLSDFNAPYFVSKAIKYEGYLFPDSYYFLANAKTDEIIYTMRNNFNEKIKTISDEIKNFGRNIKDIVIMASIIEEETRADESRKVVSGILWKRIDDNIPLQVDAPFYYITGKAGNFTLDDLKIDSPYNTYKNKGLPFAPISNPGFSTILDTITPIKTSYWYYLNGKDGEIHYADTFAKHLENKNTYLK